MSKKHKPIDVRKEEKPLSKEFLEIKLHVYEGAPLSEEELRKAYHIITKSLVDMQKQILEQGGLIIDDGPKPRCRSHA